MKYRHIDKIPPKNLKCLKGNIMRKLDDILEGVLAEIENNLKDGINADALADEFSLY